MHHLTTVQTNLSAIVNKLELLYTRKKDLIDRGARLCEINATIKDIEAEKRELENILNNKNHVNL